MMEDIKRIFNTPVNNLLENKKIRFYSLREDNIRYNNNVYPDGVLNIVYKSNTIHKPEEQIGIEHPLDLMYKIKPFFYHLFSKYRNEIPWHHSYKIIFKVTLSLDTGKFYTLLNEYEMFERGEPLFRELEVERIDQHLYLDEDIMEEDLNNFINVPFQIVIEVDASYCYFTPLRVEEEILTQDFEPPKVTKSFKTNKCVICLSSELKIFQLLTLLCMLGM